ncbi:MAG: ATP-binding protein [Planctomycetes bacterium]|nr:ATP-binding protein [Planctomycetota bacterium]
MEDEPNSLDKYQWVFPREVGLLVDLREKIQQVMEDLPMDDKQKLRMVMCVDEAAANIVEHTVPKEDDENFVYIVTAEVLDGYFKVIFSDKGMPYDPTQAPLVDIKAHVKSGKKDGLGVHIMRLSLDILEYEYDESGENIFTLGMKIAQKDT